MYFLTDQLLTFATSFVTYFGKKCFKCKTKLFNVQELVFNIRSYPTQHHLNALAYGANTCIYFPILYSKIIILVPTQAQSFSFKWIWTFSEGRGLFFCFPKLLRGGERRLGCNVTIFAKQGQLSWATVYVLGFSCLFLGFVVFTVFLGHLASPDGRY